MNVIGYSVEQRKDGYLGSIPWFQFGLLALLFGMWAAAASLNDILITNFKSVFDLSNVASAFVQTAFYLGYFVIAIPAARVIRRFTYKTAIVIGLVLYILGCVLFFPASHAGSYAPFLIALFVIAVGLSFLETSANTYATMMGPEKSSTQRLTIAQTIYPIGSVAGVLMGKYLVFGGGDSLDQQLAQASSEAERTQIAETALQATLHPYLIIIVILSLILVGFLVTKFPHCKPLTDGNQEQQAGIGETLAYLVRDKDFVIGIITQFIYIGMQTAVWSFTIRLALTLDSSLNERAATNFLIASFVLFFFGRGSASWLMNRISPAKVLAGYSLIGTLLMFYVVVGPGLTAVWAAVASVFFFAPNWPIIYGQTLSTIREARFKETGGAIIVMSIVGGAVLPVIQGAVSDAVNMQFSFIVCALAYVVVLAYAIYMSRRNVELPAA